jgi:hypothetical protein
MDIDGLYECKWCGDDFENEHKIKGKIYCSRKCKDAAHENRRAKREKKVKICVYCGKEHYRQKYCSDECCSKYHNESYKRKLNKTVCVFCGKVEYLSYERTYCSADCRTNYRVLKGITKPKSTSILIRECKVCGKPYIIRSVKAASFRSRYCSSECHLLVMNEIRCYMEQTQRDIDPLFRLECNIKTALSKGVRDTTRWIKWDEILGYKLIDLKKHLDNQFTEGMTWDNYGEWHVDHIKPKSWFNYKSIKDKEFKECWGLNNLQPLWAKDNISKGNRYEG